MISFKQFIKEDKKDEVENELRKVNIHNDLKDHVFHSDELQHLQNYADDSEYTNKDLWTKHISKGRFQLNSGTENHVKKLDSAISSQKMPYDVEVHSGIKYDPRTKMNSEGIVHHPAYLSTSLDKGMAKSFAMSRNDDGPDNNGIRHSHTIKFTVPKGHPGAYLGDDRFPNPGEHEVLLPRGLNLKHVKTEDEPEERYLKKPIINHVHHMEIVK